MKKRKIKKLRIIKISRKQVQKLIPIKKIKSNKTDAGKALIIAGSKNMPGAAILCSQAAGRIGAGYTILATDKKSFPIAKNPDFIIYDSAHINLKKTNPQSIAIGPGIGLSLATKKIFLKTLKETLKQSQIPLVIDADGLTFLAKFYRKKLPISWILTPHEGELSRLIQVSSNKIKKNRLKYILAAQKQWGCVIVLKGHKTLICDGRQVYEIQSGNPALAKAGTGDVLTGIITGLLAQKLTPTQAACAGCFIHGYLADYWLKLKKDHLSLFASDLIKLIPDVLKVLRTVK